MNCTLGKCPRVVLSKGGIWREKDTVAARASGWFIYDERAPVWFLGQEILGMAMCPECRATDRGKRMEALHGESLKSVAF